MNRRPARLFSLALGAVILAAAARSSRPGPLMAEAAGKFLAALTQEQRARAVYPFDADERLKWHFIPKSRKGLPLKEMDERQRELARTFLRAGLSQQGYLKATTIMSLEEVLRALEGGRGPIRDPDLYFFTVFGEPSEKETWGWRVEGHHLSLNFTVVQGRLIASTPQFFGANPAEVKEGPRRGLRVLHAEGDANHIHTVWRDFHGDFGEDLLREHYRAYHRPQPVGAGR